jgi:hypothetical protein
MLHHIGRKLASVLVALVFTASAAAMDAPVASADGCVFVLGFASLHSVIPDITGACADNESHSPDNGDAVQHTTNGLLVWRKADNGTAFTDGFWSWVHGPDGLQQRLNIVRFAWEANPDNLPVVTAGDIGAAAAAQGCARAIAATAGTPGQAFVKANCGQSTGGQGSAAAAQGCAQAIAATTGTMGEPYVRAACAQVHS